MRQKGDVHCIFWGGGGTGCELSSEECNLTYRHLIKEQEGEIDDEVVDAEDEDLPDEISHGDVTVPPRRV